MAYYNYIGAIGYIIVAFGMFSNDDLKTKKLVITACLFNALYFYLQGLFGSASIAALTAIRIFVSLFDVTRQAVWFFIFASVSAPLIVPGSDHISIISGLLGTIAVYWFQGIAMRSLMLTGTAFWIINNGFEGAWIGFFGEIFVFVVGFSRIIMMHRARLGDHHPDVICAHTCDQEKMNR